MNYAKALPRDKNNEAFQNSPPSFKALATYGGENSSASSVISLTQDTTAIEIAATGGAAVVRWIPTTETASVSPFASVLSAVSGANFDHVIPTGTVRRFVVPREAVSTTFGSVVGVNRAEALYQRVAIKSVGVASVMTTEY